MQNQLKPRLGLTRRTNWTKDVWFQSVSAAFLSLSHQKRKRSVCREPRETRQRNTHVYKAVRVIMCRCSGGTRENLYEKPKHWIYYYVLIFELATWLTWHTRNCSFLQENFARLKPSAQVSKKIFQFSFCVDTIGPERVLVNQSTSKNATTRKKETKTTTTNLRLCPTKATATIRPSLPGALKPSCTLGS